MNKNQNESVQQAADRPKTLRIVLSIVIAFFVWMAAMLAAPQSLHRHSRFVARLHPAARVPRRCRRARAISTCLAKTWAVHDTKG